MLHSSDIHSLMLQPISAETNLVKEMVFNKNPFEKQRKKSNGKQNSLSESPRSEHLCYKVNVSVCSVNPRRIKFHYVFVF